MNPFDKLRPEIPLQDAAEFFIGIKKFAEWTDPPDMAGELEGMFAVPVEQVIDKLKQVISAKYRKMVAYYTYAQSFRGPWWRAAKIEFCEHAEDEMEGAEFYVKRAVALGGPVHMDPIEPPPPSNNPFGILKIMARAEQEGILAQRELREMVGDDNPMKITIEEHMAKDQHHLDEVWQMMTQAEHAMVDGGAPDEMPEAAPPEELPEEAPVEEVPEEAPVEEVPEEEEPIEEKAASMRFTRALQKLAADSSVDPHTAALLKGKGEERGIAGLAAEAKRESGRRGQRLGRTVGMLGGGAAGAALGRKYLGGSPAGTLGGALLGALAGRSTGGELGTEADIARNRSKTHILGSKDQQAIEDRLQAQGATKRVMGPKGRVVGYQTKSAAMRFTRALNKLANEAAMAGDAQMASPGPGGQEMQPQNFLQAELMGQQAQSANESQYYRQQLQGTQQQMASMQQQVSDAQMQLQQVQQQAGEANMQIQQAAQAMEQQAAQATQQTMEAAKARLGAQQLRQQMLEVASQDPDQLGAGMMGPSPEEQAMMQAQGMPGAEGGMAPGEAPPDMAGGAPAGPEGPAGMAPGPQTAPGAAPAEMQPDMNAPAGGPMGLEGEGAEATTGLKTGSAQARMLGAAGGAALGAGSSLLRGAGAGGLRSHLAAVQGKQDGGFRRASQLAAAKSDVAEAELSEKHPAMSAIKGGLLGAAGGALMGPSIAAAAKDLPDAARGAGRLLGMK